MVFEQIEQLKSEYTDKYVVIDETRPELLRFRGMTGTVKTVNMSGRALVQFDGENHQGWFDIDISSLKIIDQPLPKSDGPKRGSAEGKAEAKAAPAKAAPAKAAAAQPGGKMSVEAMLAAARAEKGGGAKRPRSLPRNRRPKPPAKAAPGGKGMSVADILAAARGEKSEGGSATTAPPAAEKPAAEKPATAAAQPAATKPAAADAKSMSVADILAAARAEKSGAAAESAPTATPESEPTPEPEAAAPAEQAAAEQPAAKPATPRDQLPTDVDGIVAYCRQTDGS